LALKLALDSRVLALVSRIQASALKGPGLGLGLKGTGHGLQGSRPWPRPLDFGLEYNTENKHHDRTEACRACFVISELLDIRGVPDAGLESGG